MESCFFHQVVFVSSTLLRRFLTELLAVVWDGTSSLCYVADADSIGRMFIPEQLHRRPKLSSLTGKIFASRFLQLCAWSTSILASFVFI